MPQETLIKLGRRLAQELRELAEACELAARGDTRAKLLLSRLTIGSPLALVIGTGDVGRLINGDEE